MSTCLSSKNGIKAKKRHRCCLCGELIHAGETYDLREGVESGEGFWKMKMHPECHAYEQKPGTVDYEWYEDGLLGLAFEREEARDYYLKQQGDK